jgi:IS66 C-terminal element
MLVRPATSHAAHDRQRIFGRRAAMFSRSRLAHTQLGVLAAAPMNRKHHVARLLVDIDDNVDDQSPQQLLASPHGDARRIPRLREVLRQIGKSIRIDFDLGLLCDRSALLQIADAAERGLPILLQLGGDETIVRIACSIPPLGQTRLVSRLPQFQVQDSLLFFLLFPMHPFRLECGFDRHWLHGPEQLPCDRRINPRTAECHAPFTYLKDVLERLSNGYPMARLDDLLPWNWTSKVAAAP